MTSDPTNPIIEAALAAHTPSVLLIKGKVYFGNGRDWEEITSFAGDAFDMLWNFASLLDLDPIQRRTMAPQLVPNTLRHEWTARVYFGPNTLDETNALIDLLPTPEHFLKLHPF